MTKSDMLRVIKFGIVGGSGVVVNMGILKALSFTALILEVRSPIAIFTAMTTNFLLNHFWTWKDKKISLKREFALRYSKFFLSSGGTALLFNYLPLLFMVNKLGWNESLSNFWGIGVAAVANYFISHFWTFKHKHDTHLYMDATEDETSFYLTADPMVFRIQKSGITSVSKYPEEASPLHGAILLSFPEEIRQREDGTIALKVGERFITLFDELEVEGEMMEGSAVYHKSDEEFMMWWGEAKVLELLEE